jgi:hypothetical protein
MPRLVGKQSNGSGYIALLLLAAAGTVGAMEYAGIINVIPGFGKDYLGEPDVSHESEQQDTSKYVPEDQQVQQLIEDKVNLHSSAQFVIPTVLSKASH